MPAETRNKTRLSKLEPIHYLDVVSTTLLKKWLSNTSTKPQWEDSIDNVIDVFDDAAEKQKASLMGLIKKPEEYKNIDPMLLGKVIKDYVDNVLDNWKANSDNVTAKVLAASLPLFIEMSKYLPHVNPSNEYKIAFRGTEISDNKAIKFLKANPDPKDWKRTVVGGKSYMAYIGPKKNQFMYTPHRMVQSWSVSDKAASEFGSSIVATPLDKSFFFDPAFLGQYDFKKEKETIHFGQEPMKVALLLNKSDYDQLIGNGSKNSLGSPKDIEFMANEFYDGSILMYKIDKLLQYKKGIVGWYDDNYDKLKDMKKFLGQEVFDDKWTKELKKLQAMPDLYEATGKAPIVNIPDEEGTLSIPL